MIIGLFTDTYYPEINGVANSTYVLKNALEEMGHTVYVFTSQAGIKEKEDHVFRIRSVKPAMVKDRSLALPLEPYWKKKIKKLKLDIIHTHTEFTMGFLGMRMARYLDVPLVHTYHTMYEDYTHYFKLPGNARLKPFIGTLSRKFCNHTDHIIVPTDKVRKKLWGYKINRRVDVIPTGLDLEKYQKADQDKVDKLKKKYGLEGKKVLLFIGRVAKEKNIDQVIHYFHKISKDYKDYQLVIVGDGPASKGLKDQVAKEKLKSRVTFTGMVPWDEIQNYYALGDIFVSASTSETQGLTYNEALACGLPILVRRDPCLKNVLVEGENGMGFESEEEFIEGFKAIIKMDNQRPEAYSSMDFARLVLGVYKKLVKEDQAGQRNRLA